MSHAVVALLPVPVAPSSTTSFSPFLIRSVSSAIAAGWSPAGLNSLMTSKGATTRLISCARLMDPIYNRGPTLNGPIRNGRTAAAPDRRQGPYDGGTHPVASAQAVIRGQATSVNHGSLAS